MRNRMTLLVAASLLVVACGGESSTTATSAPDSGPTTTTAATTTSTAGATTTTEAGAAPALTAVRAALGSSAEVSSGRVEGSISVTGADGGTGTPVDYQLPFSAAFDRDAGNSSFSMDMSSVAQMGGQDVPADLAGMFGEMEVRVVDGTSYIKFPFFGMMFGATTPWISAPAQEGEDMTSAFTFALPADPTTVFREYLGADAQVTEVGRETVNGVDATHYQARFDTAAMIAEASPDELARLESNAPLPQTVLPMDIWVSDSGQVVRYSMDIDGSDLASADDATGATQTFDHMVMTFDLLDIGQPVDIVAPDPSEVTDVSDLSPMMSIPGTEGN